MKIENKFFKFYPLFKNNKFFNNNEICKEGLYKYICIIKSLIHEVLIFLKSALFFYKRSPKSCQLWIEEKKSIIQKSSLPSIIWIGHATFLIQIGDINILTDAIFANATFLFPRIFKPAIELKDLPKIDYVIISHNHMDHMDSFSLITLKKMFPEIKFLVPMGDKKWFEKNKISNVEELMWWDVHAASEIKFTFLPAQHWSQRGLFDNNKSLWGSWMIEYNNFFIYFAGDTAYSNHFQYISKEFPKIDVALMPIGPCEPKDKMCHSHINAEEAVQSFIDLGANNFIPMHWGTFYFGTDFFDTPINRLKESWQQNFNLLYSKNLHIVKFGQRLEFNLNESQKELNKDLSKENNL